MIQLSPPPGDESRPELVEIIRAEIEKLGQIAFARFMEFALGTPGLGYYASGESTAGTSGDFLTAPETHPIFGAVVARQIHELWKLLGEPSGFTVREYGAGRGTLAVDILRALSQTSSDALRGWVYELSDLGAFAVRDALEMIAARGYGAFAREAGNVPFGGVALANELLDALPFHRLVQQGGELLEIYTTIRDGWFVDELGRVSDEAAAALPDSLALVEGQRIEVSPAIPRWLVRLFDAMDAGFVLLLDYGFPRPEIHDPGRFPRGTLKTYRRHKVGEDPYLDIGRRDVTAHVDFTAVSDAAAEAGFDVVGLTTQAEFVAGLGIDELLLEIQGIATSADEYVAARSAVMQLLDPRGLGRFRVLILSKDVPAGVQPRGLSYRLPVR
jgi:SAM-dependent MidA family methyltransferase